ncbi:ABC transporter substrate-binding protein [Microbacterium sp. RD1]|uniref:ABC transporter substrate-binding protein n=1 Tax=Microbacterium sp. RD1 TaxID=3457313 RepID=UPI003FA57AB2
MTRLIKRSLATAILSLGAAGVLSACASAGATSGSGSAAPASGYDCASPNADTRTTVSVSALPILSTGALYAGIEEGFFAEHGLDLGIESVSTLPAAISAVQGGTTDFGFAGTLPLMQALQNGIPVQIVAPFAGIAPGYYDKMKAGEEGYTTEVSALLTMRDSGIDSPGDLDGKTVAVSDVQGQAELTTRYVIDENGGDSESVTFTVLSPADAYNALLAGQVDAAYSAVPIILTAEEDGAQVISWPGVEALKEGPTSVIVATDQFVADNPEIVSRFNCAMRSVTTFASENPDAVRAAMADALDVDPETYASAVVPYFYNSVDVAGIEKFQDLMLDYGYLTGPIDLKSVVAPVALDE